MSMALQSTSPRPIPPSRRAFTLIELMVVVGIIIILIAILLPALAGAREQAYRVQTSALLNGLSNNIETYFLQFDAYPGPAPAGVTGASKIPGTQSLFIALTYSMYTADPTPPPTNYNPKPMPGGSGVRVDAGNPTGPIDLSTGKAYSAFYNPNTKEISPFKTKGPPAIWDFGGIAGAFNATMDFPTILDRFPDALPILYFRRTPGSEGAITYAADYSITTQTMVAEDATTPASFYRSDNKEYLDSPGLTSPTGRVYAQAGNSGIFGAGSKQNENLARLFAGETASTTLNAHGGFVLMSASSDRVYGQNTKKSNKSDDIIVIGGH